MKKHKMFQSDFIFEKGSVMKERNRKIFITAAIVGVVVLLALAILFPSTIRILLVVPFLLFLPGYGLIALLFPRPALDIPARLLLSVGLSLATTAFIGLILNMTSPGLRIQNPLLLLLVGGLGLLGLRSLIMDVRQVDRSTIPARIGLDVRQMVLFGLAAVITTIAIFVARTPSSPKDLLGYTLFWVQAGKTPNSLEVGVRSEEFQTTKFQVRFDIKGETKNGPTFELGPGQTWDYSLKLDGENLTGQPVTLLLYRLDDPTKPYRRVEWWHENN
jgi:uncharacterized membrane protein